MNLFEIAWLAPEQVKLFKSDFQYVADYFVQVRMTDTYVPRDDGGTIEHIQEVLQLLDVMSGDHRFEDVLNDKNIKEVPKNMSSVIDMYVEKGAAAERARYADERRRYADERQLYETRIGMADKRIAELEAQVAALGGRP